MSLLSAQQLSKRYGDRHAVKDITLEVNSGEIVGLLGPNGAGKTTSFYMIVGLVPVDNGTIYLDQHEITNYPIH
jgi:lipopolysaccharide export system ATP-binding protein